MEEAADIGAGGVLQASGVGAGSDSGGLRRLAVDETVTEELIELILFHPAL